MTVPLARRSIPPYLPSAANYQPTHPDKFLIQFAEDGQEFGSCLKVVRVSSAGKEREGTEVGDRLSTLETGADGKGLGMLQEVCKRWRASPRR